MVGGIQEAFGKVGEVHSWGMMLLGLLGAWEYSMHLRLKSNRDVHIFRGVVFRGLMGAPEVW